MAFQITKKYTNSCVHILMSRVGNELLNVDFGVTFAGSYTFVFINKLLNHASENYQHRKKVWKN